MRSRALFTLICVVVLVYGAAALASMWTAFTGPISLGELSILAMQMAGMPMAHQLARGMPSQSGDAAKSLSYIDELTGLSSRAYFISCIEEALEANDSAHWVAIMHVDLDRFKLLNDTLGHAAGDRALFEVSQRFKRQIVAGVTLARMGGDEFGVLMEGLTDQGDAESLATRLLQALEASFPVKGHEVVVNSSIGLALATGANCTADELMRRADVALYRAKADGRGCWRVFKPDMGAASVERLDLGSGLRRAIQRDELVLHFQPQVCLATGRTDRFEALVRWQHPDRGLLSPSAFIPCAEEAGLIRSIGRWVMREACLQTVDWLKQFPEQPQLGVSVNVSPLEFREPDLALEIQRTLIETGLPPDRLEVEIVESALMTDVEGTLKTLRALRQMGVRLAIDDFGTGYSSLSYLRKFPIDSLKIDRSFLLEAATDRRNLAIVQSMVALAHALDIEVTAEGVETTAQLSLLINAKCDRAQGYLLARPLAREDVYRYLSSQPDARPAPAREAVAA